MEKNCSALALPFVARLPFGRARTEKELLKNADLLVTEKYLDDETLVKAMGKGLVHTPGRGKK